MARVRRSFNTEFKREAAGLVLKEGYSVAEACRSLDVGETAMYRLGHISIFRLRSPPGLKHEYRPHELRVICPAIQVLLPGFPDTFCIKNALLFKGLL